MLSVKCVCVCVAACGGPIEGGLPFTTPPRNNTGFIVMGGINNNDYLNDMMFADLTHAPAVTWVTLRSDEEFPAPRCLHSIIPIGFNLFMFGGQDSKLDVNADFWQATLTSDASGSDFVTIKWRKPPVVSSLAPTARHSHISFSCVFFILSSCCLFACFVYLFCFSSPLVCCLVHARVS